MTTFAWWGDFSDGLLLKHYNFDWDSEQTNEERLVNVQPENLSRVKELNLSHMGIGWPLQAIIGTITFSPYFVIALFLNLIIKLLRNKPNSP